MYSKYVAVRTTTGVSMITFCYEPTKCNFLETKLLSLIPRSPNPDSWHAQNRCQPKESVFYNLAKTFNNQGSFSRELHFVALSYTLNRLYIINIFRDSQVVTSVALKDRI